MSKTHRIAFVLVLLLSTVWAGAPSWSILERLTPAERGNARIDIELNRGQPESVRALAGRIEDFWNSGEYAAALELFPELAEMTGGEQPVVGIAWRKPIPSPELDFNPFTVSDRDSVYVVDFEIDWRLTRRFFCVLALLGDDAVSRMSVNYSTDLGQTWSEVFILSGYNYKLNDVAGRIMLSRYWLVYTGGTVSAPNHALWCRQFLVSNGTPDTFLSGSTSDNFYNTPARDTVRELAMVSSQLPANGTIYMLALMASDSLRYFTLPVTNDTAWRTLPLAWADGLGGLDACWNDDRLSGDTSLLFVSYLTTGDSVRILREILGGGWERYRSVHALPRGYVTSVAAHRDTIICAYSDDGRARYQIRRGSGPWAVGEPPQDTTLDNTVPDVCALGGYFHYVYRASTSLGWYTRRPYSSYSWEAARRFDGTFHVAYDIRPDVQWIGRGETAGVVWVSLPSNAGRARYAFFDYSGIAESENPDRVPGRVQVAANHNGVRVRYQVDQPGRVELAVLDITGRQVSRFSEWQPAGVQSRTMLLPDAGAYFLRLRASGKESVTKFTYCH